MKHFRLPSIKRSISVALRVLCILILCELGLHLDIVRKLSLQDIGNTLSLRRQHTYRIVCFGTSFALGDADSFPAQLENILNEAHTGIRFTVINKATFGQTIGMIADTLNETLDTCRPDMVIMLTGLEDSDAPVKAHLSLLARSRLYQLLRAAYDGFRSAPKDKRIDYPRWVEIVHALFRVERLHRVPVPGIQRADRYRELLAYMTRIPTTFINPGAAFYFLPYINYPEPTSARVCVSPHIFLSSVISEESAAHSMDKQDFPVKGQLYADAGRYSLAEEMFRLHIARYPDDDGVATRLAQLYRKFANDFEAENVLSRTIALPPPRSRESFLTLAQLYANQRRYLSAERVLQQAIGSDHDDRVYYAALAGIYEDMRDYGKAEALNKRLTRIDPASDTGWTNLGQLYLKTGNETKAEQCLRTAIQLNGARTDICRLLSEQYRYRGDLTSAENILLSAYERNPLNPDACLNLAYFYTDTDNYQAAENLCLKAISLAPRQAATHIALGKLQQQKQQFNKAIESFKRALLIEPAESDIPVLIGTVYLDLGDDARATEFFEQAIRLNPNRPNDFARTALENIRAIKELKARLDAEPRAGPDDQKKYLALSSEYARVNRKKQTEETLKAALRISPNDLIYCHLADVYASMRDYPRALDAIGRAIAMNPLRNNYYVTRGRIYEQIRDFRNAEKSYRRMIELAPRHYIGYSTLANFFWERNDPGTAITIIREGLAQCGDRAMPELYRVLQRIKGTERDLNLEGTMSYSRTVVARYREIKYSLDRRKVRLVCIQYPLRRVEPLADIFAGDKGVIFVDNNVSFRKLLRPDNYGEYFVDLSQGDFGHATRKGNRIIAQNIAQAIFANIPALRPPPEDH